MNQVCYVLPVLDEKIDTVRRLMRELRGAERRQYSASRERRGILKETWYLQHTPGGAVLVILLEGQNVARVRERDLLPPDLVGQWLAVRLQECVDVDPGGDDVVAPAEQIHSYEMQRAHLHV
jgi:hypothetical protein